jgi:hypothetical protein
LEEVIVTGSLGKLNFPMQEIINIIETAQARFNKANGGGNGGGGIFNNFANGFLNGPSSNLQSGSAWSGYGGLHLTKYEQLFRYSAKTSTNWADKASNLRKAKGLAVAGKGLGLIGVGAVVYEDLKENKFGIGTGVKVGIGVITTFIGGPVVLTYLVTDIAVGFITGTTLTDRIANGVESAFSN